MNKFLTRISLAAILLIVAAGLLNADNSSDGWTTDYAKALAQAKTEKKIVLLDFTGSDWCPYCIRLDKEVFAEPKFQEYAKKNLILVQVDFPVGKTLPPELKKQNSDLQDKYDIQAYPTVVVLDSDGKKLGELGYEEGGPDKFLESLAKLEKN